MTVIVIEIVKDTGFAGSLHTFNNVADIIYGKDEEGTFFTLLSKSGNTTKFYTVSKDLMHCYMLEENHE